MKSLLMTDLLTQKTSRAIAPNFFIFLMSLVPFLFLPLTHLFLPNLGIGALYFWAVYCPEKISLWVIFGSGLLQDGLFGTPLGLFGCLNLLFWILTIAHRKYLFKRSFLMGWFGFFILYSVTFILKECVIWALQRPLYSESMMLEEITSLLSYPFVAIVCLYVHRKSS
jgi:rod shape-determining protein MreD